MSKERELTKEEIIKGLRGISDAEVDAIAARKALIASKKYVRDHGYTDGSMKKVAMVGPGHVGRKISLQEELDKMEMSDVTRKMIMSKNPDADSIPKLFSDLVAEGLRLVEEDKANGKNE